MRDVITMRSQFENEWFILNIDRNKNIGMHWTFTIAHSQRTEKVIILIHSLFNHHWRY